MGGKGSSGAWRRLSFVQRPLATSSALAVVAPLAALLAVAFGVSAAAWRLHAPLLHAGSWAWLGDAALGADLLAVLAFAGLPAAARRERVLRSAIGDVDEMSGEAFEARLATLFFDLGFVVTRTGARGDFGADLLLEHDDERVVVQAKRYDGAVGIEAVQQVVGATRVYDATGALVVTNSTCTPAATELAAAHDVELVERERLVALLAAYPLAYARAGGPSILVREVVCGAAVLLFAATRLLGLGWLAVRLTARLPAALLRAPRR